MSKYLVVNNSLRRFDELQFCARKHAKTVTAFIKTIKYYFHISKAPDFCRNCFFIRYGSNIERTVVSAEADFDLIMVLPNPFTLENLYPTQYSEGVFMLNTERSFIPDSRNNKYFTEEGQLKSLKLRTDIFKIIGKCLEKLKDLWDGWNITYLELLTNMKIRFDNGRGRVLIIDIIPQIGAHLECNEIPGCIEVSDFHPVLQSYVQKHNFSSFYVLAFPPHVRDSADKHLLLQTNFGLLEFSGIKCSDNVRNTIRMCKGISMKTRMKVLGLSSFHIKRTALRCLDELINSDPYYGIRHLLRSLKSSLVSGSVADYFIPEQNIFKDKKKNTLDLSREIHFALKSIYSEGDFSLLDC